MNVEEGGGVVDLTLGGEINGPTFDDFPEFDDPELVQQNEDLENRIADDLGTGVQFNFEKQEHDFSKPQEEYFNAISEKLKKIKNGFNRKLKRTAI
jgi:hypothetical protein